MVLATDLKALLAAHAAELDGQLGNLRVDINKVGTGGTGGWQASALERTGKEEGEAGTAQQRNQCGMHCLLAHLLP